MHITTIAPPLPREFFLSKKLLVFSSRYLLPTVLAECILPPLCLLTCLPCGSRWLPAPQEVPGPPRFPPCQWPSETDTILLCTFHLRYKSLFWATAGFQKCFKILNSRGQERERIATQKRKNQLACFSLAGTQSSPATSGRVVNASPREQGGN